MVADAYEEFVASEAILHGHFVLSSKRHSAVYVQCAKVLENPVRAQKVCAMLAEKIRFEQSALLRMVDVIVSPAMGGIIVGYEISKQFGINSIFCERIEGVFALRRGFRIVPNSRVMIIEDVLTTGKSSMETARCITENGGNVILEGVLIKRDPNVQLPFPVVSLLDLDIPSYDEANIPEDLRKIPATIQGSRFTNKAKPHSTNMEIDEFCSRKY